MCVKMVNKNKISVEQSNFQNAEREENYFRDSSSVCSEEASNYPEGQKFVSKVNTPLKRRTRNSHKRPQLARKHDLWKEKGETKVDKKMRALQQLIPNCPNVDDECVLDEAIAYIKNLQNQLQFIRSSNAFAARMYTSGMLTLPQPNMMHQFYASSTTRNHTFSSLPSHVGSRIQMPTAREFIKEPSQLSNSSSFSSFSSYGSL